jgi:hypothetical protein
MTTTASPATFGGRTHIATDLTDPGEITAEVHFDPDTAPPIEADAEVIRVTWPQVGAETAAKWECSGFCTGFEVTDPMEDIMTASLTVKLSGGVTITAAAV